MKISKLSAFKPSTNAQLIPIRQLELFKERNKFEADATLPAADKLAKVAEIDRKLAELSRN
jgi:phosphonate transport system substrate-binding protein